MSGTMINLDWQFYLDVHVGAFHSLRTGWEAVADEAFAAQTQRNSCWICETYFLCIRVAKTPIGGWKCATPTTLAHIRKIHALRKFVHCEGSRSHLAAEQRHGLCNIVPGIANGQQTGYCTTDSLWFSCCCCRIGRPASPYRHTPDRFKKPGL